MLKLDEIQLYFKKKSRGLVILSLDTNQFGMIEIQMVREILKEKNELKKKLRKYFENKDFES